MVGLVFFFFLEVRARGGVSGGDQVGGRVRTGRGVAGVSVRVRARVRARVRVRDEACDREGGGPPEGLRIPRLDPRGVTGLFSVTPRDTEGERSSLVTS